MSNSYPKKILLAMVLFPAFAQTRAQERPLSFHGRALVSQYYATNRSEWTNPLDAYFFAPSIGGNAEAIVRYRPGRGRVFFETGACAWIWHYRAVINTRSTRTQYHDWDANNGGASFGIPLRAGIHIRQMFSLTAGAILLHNVSSTRMRRLDFQSSIQGEEVGSPGTELEFAL